MTKEFTVDMLDELVEICKDGNVEFAKSVEDKLNADPLLRQRFDAMQGNTMALSTEEVGALVKELADLIAQEQSPNDSPAINRRIGVIAEVLWQHLAWRASNLS